MIVGHKLEINMHQTTPTTISAIDMAMRNRVQAIVMHPEMIIPSRIHLTSVTNSPKLIAAIDFPHGKAYAVDKLKQYNTDILSADGYEFLLSGGSDAQIHNEMRFLMEWAKEVNRLAEIRWVLPLELDDKVLKSVLKHNIQFKADYIRIDSRLEHKESRHDLLKGLKKLKYIGKIKASCNVDLALIADNQNIDRFDVTINQANAIIREAAPLKSLKKEEAKEEPKEEAKEERKVTGILQEDDGYCD
jgi:hypothetical protein